MKPTPPPPPPPPPKPYDARIEYLESSGTQYIDTLYNANDATEFRMKYSGFTNMYFGCGGRQGFGAPGFTFSNGGETSRDYPYYFLYYNRAYQGKVTCPNDGNIHEVQMNNVVIVDNVVIYTFATGSFVNSNTFALFCTNNEQGRKYFGYMKIYSCSIIENGNNVREFIPVRVGQVGYMYDQVSGQLFGNSGTGEFILGPDIE